MVEAKKQIQIAISFDTTGSMYPCIKEVKRNLTYLLDKLFQDIEGIEVAIIAHGDYCDKDKLYQQVELTKDKDILTNFINNAEQTGGGDTPEAYEYVLNKVRSLNWDPNANKVLVMIGDAQPHKKGETNAGIIVEYDYEEESIKLKEQGISIFAVHCLAFTDKISSVANFMKTIANNTDGLYIKLDQFSYIVELLIAIAYRQSGQSNFDLYEAYVRNNRSYNKQVQRMFDIVNPKLKDISEERKEEERKELSENIRASDPSRFQVLNVENDCSIKQFVQDMGLVFKKGRGFYEHTKKEKVQDNKEIVIMERETGKIFEGEAAASIANVEKGQKNAYSHNDKYITFIQSTSNNRKLIGGTKFLYDASI